MWVGCVRLNHARQVVRALIHAGTDVLDLLHVTAALQLEAADVPLAVALAAVVCAAQGASNACDFYLTSITLRTQHS